MKYLIAFAILLLSEAVISQDYYTIPTDTLSSIEWSWDWQKYAEPLNEYQSLHPNVDRAIQNADSEDVNKVEYMIKITILLYKAECVVMKKRPTLRRFERWLDELFEPDTYIQY